MHKHTPTQFYNVQQRDGMSLRSGKKINCITSTEFGKEALSLIRVFRLTDIAEGEGYSTGDSWHEFEYHTPSEIANVERMAGGFYSPMCIRMIALERFITKWRTFINKEYSISYKEAMCEKIKDAIKILEAMKNGTAPIMRGRTNERFCGCGSRDRSFHDNTAWDYYLYYGPGYLQEDEHGVNDWIQTPEVSHEEFEAQYTRDRNSWRHDRFELLDRYKSHLEYFTRVPHKAYQEAYFALSSKKTPSACAKHILSFL